MFYNLGVARGAGLTRSNLLQRGRQKDLRSHPSRGLIQPPQAEFCKKPVTRQKK